MRASAATAAITFTILGLVLTGLLRNRTAGYVTMIIAFAFAMAVTGTLVAGSARGLPVVLRRILALGAGAVCSATWLFMHVAARERYIEATSGADAAVMALPGLIAFYLASSLSDRRPGLHLRPFHLFLATLVCLATTAVFTPPISKRVDRYWYRELYQAGRNALSAAGAGDSTVLPRLMTGRALARLSELPVQRMASRLATPPYRLEPICCASAAEADRIIAFRVRPFATDLPGSVLMRLARSGSRWTVSDIHLDY